MTTIFPSLEDYDVGDVSGLGEGVTLSQEEMDEEEYRIRANPVSWAYWKLKDPKGNPWEARWYQAMMIDGIVEGDRRIAARMGRRVGKCMPGHVKVFDPTTGEQVPIQKLYERQQANVLTMNSEFKINPSKSSHVWDNGIKEVFKVTLKSGRVVEATGNHPLYRIDGWTEIDDLAVGDRIATPRIINHFGSKYMSDEELAQLEDLTQAGELTKERMQHLLQRYLTSYEAHNMNEENARFLQHALLRFGIQANITKEDTWSVIIPPNMYEQTQYALFNNQKAYSEYTWSANHYAEEVLRLEKEGRLQSVSLLHPNASMLSEREPVSTKTKHHALSLNRIKSLTNSDIYWDEIVSIESQGAMQTYDLTIPETKNFIANDVIVHNTETMVVYCLWRAFHQRNQRMLIVAPYENQVRLIFMRLEELVNDSEELASSIKITKNPFIATFGNGSKIMGFTGGANSGSQSGASVRGQRADKKYTKAA